MLNVQRLDPPSSLDRLSAVQRVLTEKGVDAYIIPSADAHNSEIITPADARREWVSRFRGSYGTAVVLTSRALLWTDARYFTQFDAEVDAQFWKLMKDGMDASIPNWLAANVPPASVVAVDPTTYTRELWTPLAVDRLKAVVPTQRNFTKLSFQKALESANVTLRAMPVNLVDEARRSIDDGPPARPSNPLVPHHIAFSGKPASDKISRLHLKMSLLGADVLVLTALDDIAYTLNLRGTDIPYSPVFFAYLVVRAEEIEPNVILFWNDGNLSSDIVEHFSSEDVTVLGKPYTQVFEYLRNISKELYDGKIWLCEDSSHAVFSAVEEGSASIVKTVSPVAMTKLVKNDVELKGFRAAHVRDGVALVRALHWVHEQVAGGANATEMDLSDKLEAFRDEEENFKGPSFASIVGTGANSAIVHYSPRKDGPQNVIGDDDMLLVDSGGQYKDGTTDITRTRHMGASPSPEQRRAFTRVLKGQITLATAVLPRRTQGHVIEVLARKALWDVGLNYGHGTGHGVGHYLNVHEGPAYILNTQGANDPGIAPKMVYSIEPGYYEKGKFGVRHEDLVEVIAMNTHADHLLAKGMVGDFEGRGAVAFHTMSLVPHQTACLDIDLMTDFEKRYLNDYHARVLSTIGPILQERGMAAEYAWLETECTPI